MAKRSSLKPCARNQSDSQGATGFRLVSFPRKRSDDRYSAFLFVKTGAHPNENQTLSELAALPQVREIHLVDGDDCCLVRVAVGGPEALARLIREFKRRDAVLSVRSLTILQTVKNPAEFRRQARA